MKRYELSRQKNIRDIGGLPGLDGKHIKYGHFFRGGAISKADKKDLKILKSFRLTDVVDFRGEEEFIHMPDVEIDGVTYHNFPAIEERVAKDDRNNEDGNLLWFVAKSKSGFEHMKQQYRNLINDHKSQTAYRNFFKILLENNRHVYYHCSQGKDRAGLASFFIETALGVDFETIKKDYLLSNEAMKEKVKVISTLLKNKPFYDENYHQTLLDVFAARLEYLESAIEEMNNNYGGPLNYIKDILCVDIDKFRKMYLE